MFKFSHTTRSYHRLSVTCHWKQVHNSAPIVFSLIKHWKTLKYHVVLITNNLKQIGAGYHGG
jgi:hypothetical protein